jgi:hypothetical protein
MSLDSRSPRRRLASAALLVALAAIAITATQCRQVEDNLLGVRVVERGGAASCIAACAKVWNDSMRVESDRHVASVQGCSGDPVCLALEEITHQNAVRRIQDGRRACQDQCHHQGGGKGGR